MLLVCNLLKSNYTWWYCLLIQLIMKVFNLIRILWTFKHNMKLYTYCVSQYQQQNIGFPPCIWEGMYSDTWLLIFKCALFFVYLKQNWYIHFHFSVKFKTFYEKLLYEFYSCVLMLIKNCALLCLDIFQNVSLMLEYCYYINLREGLC